MSKLSTYKSSKTVFAIEKYFSCISNEKHRIQIAGFCHFFFFFFFFFHNLQTEVGTYLYNRVERHNRLCKVCNMQTVEDEYHFLLICPALAE